MAVTVKNKKEDCEALATCIKTEQVPAADIVSIFNDNPEFAEWYKSKFIKEKK